MEIDRRHLIAITGSGLIGASSIARAFAIDADVRDGSIRDVKHVVTLMQENRGFDTISGRWPASAGSATGSRSLVAG